MDILAKFLCFFSLSSSFIKSIDSTCPNSFHCGDHLGYLEFPLSDSRQPDCGLFMVNCTDSTDPRIQLGDGGTWCRLIQKVSDSKYKIQDPVLETALSNSNLCLSLRNLSLPNSPSSSLTFFPDLTLFICDQNGYENAIAGETVEDYKNYSACGGFAVYYRHPTDDSHPGQSSMFQGCTVVHMPIKSNQETGDLLNLLSAEFTLEWNVSADCISCHHRGGQCVANSLDEFQCKEGSRNLRKILHIGVLSVSVITLLSIFIVLIVCIRRRKHALHKSFRLHKVNTKNERDVELFLKNNGNLAPRRYKYSELKKLTKSFDENLGKGGYGNVYKGKLQDGRVVAVKILNESRGNGE